MVMSLGLNVIDCNDKSYWFDSFWLLLEVVRCVLIGLHRSSACVVGIPWTSEGLFGVHLWHPFELGGVLEGTWEQDGKTDDDIRCAKIYGNLKLCIFPMF